MVEKSGSEGRIEAGQRDAGMPGGDPRYVDLRPRVARELAALIERP
jgi:hypothetical protein